MLPRYVRVGELSNNYRVSDGACYLRIRPGNNPADSNGPQKMAAGLVRHAAIASHKVGGAKELREALHELADARDVA
jgi:hypothetical protein